MEEYSTSTWLTGLSLSLHSPHIMARDSRWPETQECLPLLDNSRCFFHLLGGGLRRRIHLVDNHRRHTLVVGPLMQTEGCAGPKGRSVRRPSSVRPPTRARMKQPSCARASALIRGRRLSGRGRVRLRNAFLSARRRRTSLSILVLYCISCPSFLPSCGKLLSPHVAPLHAYACAWFGRPRLQLEFPHCYFKFYLRSIVK